MKKLMAELVSKLSKIDTKMTKVFEFSKINIAKGTTDPRVEFCLPK